MKRQGVIRLGIVLGSIIIIALLIPFLKIYHFSPFNSGVATIIGGVALVWAVYSIVVWVAEGFK
jgi:hypothetical protein